MSLTPLSEITQNLCTYAVQTGHLGFVRHNSKEAEHLVLEHNSELNRELLTPVSIRSYDKETNYSPLIVVVVNCEHGFTYCFDKENTSLQDLLLEAMNASLASTSSLSRV